MPWKVHLCMTANLSYSQRYPHSWETSCHARVEQASNSPGHEKETLFLNVTYIKHPFHGPFFSPCFFLTQIPRIFNPRANHSSPATGIYHWLSLLEMIFSGTTQQYYWMFRETVYHSQYLFKRKVNLSHWHVCTCATGHKYSFYTWTWGHCLVNHCFKITDFSTTYCLVCRDNGLGICYIKQSQNYQQLHGELAKSKLFWTIQKLSIWMACNKIQC